MPQEPVRPRIMLPPVRLGTGGPMQGPVPMLPMPQFPTIPGPVQGQSLPSSVPPMPPEVRKGLKDPRLAMLLLTLAGGLAQPRGVGETGVTKATQALLQGYNALATAQALQAERQRQYREELRQERALGHQEKQVEQAQQRVENEGRMVKIAEAEAPVNIEAKKAQTEATRASIKRGEEQMALEEKKYNLAEAAEKELADYRKKQLDLQREGMDKADKRGWAEIKNARDQLELALKKFQADQNNVSARLRLEQTLANIKAKTAALELRQLEERLAKSSPGSLDEETKTRLFTQAVQSVLALAPIGEDADEAYEMAVRTVSLRFPGLVPASMAPLKTQTPSVPGNPPQLFKK